MPSRNRVAKPAKQPVPLNLPARSKLTLTSDDLTIQQLFGYLNGKLTIDLTTREGKRRAVDALRAFWTPFALRAVGAAPEQIEAAALSCRRELQRQIEQIEREFALTVPLLQAEAVGGWPQSTAVLLSPAVPAPASEPLAIPAELATLAKLSDRDLLGDLLDL